MQYLHVEFTIVIDKSLISCKRINNLSDGILFTYPKSTSLFEKTENKEMGQQQLLLIVLGVIIVGIAVAFSMGLFRSAAIDHKRDLVMDECQNLANMALTYSRKPREFGGGGNSFTGWKVPDKLKNTVSGSYTANVQSDKVVITGTGNEVVNGTDSVKVQTTVEGNTFNSVVIN